MHRLLVVAGSLLLLAGCEACGEPAEPASDDQPAESTTRPGTAVIEGVVRLAPGAELPREAVNPMVAPQNRPELPEHCTPPQERDREPVRQVRGDHLAGMVVAVSGFSAEVPHEPVTHELAIRDCRLTPSTIVATLGDRLRLVNETNYPFMPEMGGGMMTALLHERDREVELGRAGMRTLACGFAASCGRTLIVTQYHPLHAVTDETGRFRIENVPVNEEIRIDAWHVLFNEAGEALTLSPGETREIEIVVTPAPARPAEPPPVDPPGRAEDNPDVLF
jgi:hypothetical protein